MTPRSIQLVQLGLVFSLTAGAFGFVGGLAAGSLRAPAPPPPAFACPPPPMPYVPPACPACPACPAPAAIRRGVLFSASGFPEYGSGYETSRLGDGDASTYWCSPNGPTLPFSATLTFELPATIEAIEIDNRLSGYDTSGAREVRIEALDLGGAVMTATTATLGQAAVTTVPFPVALYASGLRVTVLSTFGGEYAGIAEIVVHGEPPW